MRKRNWRNVTVGKLWDYIVVTNVKYALWHFSAYFPLFQDIMSWKVRPAIWRMIGVSVGKNVFIGYGVYLDVGGVKRITIEDNVIITAQSLLLAHKRDMRQYTGSNLQNELPFREENIHICSNASIGMRSMVLPGVTIGEGAVIGAASVVSKDVPSRVVAVGNPLKIIKELS